jgi:NAD(P)-dependent dehydrogenase (short-subunit alcohol dehydrogenase family)
MSAHGRVAIVTGASSGIGAAVALALVADGYRVVIAARRAQKLQEMVRSAGDAGRNLLAVTADVTDPQSVRELFARTVEAFGRLDLLFNNAGVNSPPVLLEEVTYEQWRTVVDTNLTGAFLCTQQAMTIMKAQSPRGGRIINNGSIAAQTPRPNSAPYAATKHAITGLTKATALDGRKYDIACGQIDIGNARTELADRLAAIADKPEPLMDVQHVAHAVLQMASLPLEANVLFMTIMATRMPFVGRG